MAKNNYESNEFEKKFSSPDERKEFFDERVNKYKSQKKVIYEGKDNADHEVFDVENKKKDFGKDRYFVDKGDGGGVEIYKIKKNGKAYSKYKNSEAVYVISTEFKTKDGYLTREEKVSEMYKK